MNQDITITCDDCHQQFVWTAGEPYFAKASRGAGGLMNVDKTIVCLSCKQEFVWTEGEQQFYSEKGLEAPTLCMICRARRGAAERDKRHWEEKVGKKD